MTPGNAESRVVREGVCECGDWQSLHVLGRGNCRLCRFGTPPPDGADGCQRYREASTQERPRVLTDSVRGT